MEVNSKHKAFFEYAKKKNWDASVCLYNGKYLAILNPVTEQYCIQGESLTSTSDAIDECKKELLKKLKK